MTTTRDDDRERIERDVKKFLSAGGSIQEVPPGVTGAPQRTGKGGVIESWSDWRDFER